MLPHAQAPEPAGSVLLGSLGIKGPESSPFPHYPQVQTLSPLGSTSAKSTENLRGLLRG